MLTILLVTVAVVLAVVSLITSRRPSSPASIITGAISVFIGLLSVAYSFVTGQGIFWIISALVFLLTVVALIVSIIAKTRSVANATPPTAITQSSQTNGLALASVIVVWFGAVVGVILGHIALSQVKRSGEQGRGLALTAVIAGWTLIGVSILTGVILILLSLSAPSYRY